jgi:hypothetical protein
MTTSGDAPPLSLVDNVCHRPIPMAQFHAAASTRFYGNISMVTPDNPPHQHYVAPHFTTSACPTAIRRQWLPFDPQAITDDNQY